MSERLIKEAEVVLLHIGDKIKSECKEVISAEDINALSNLTYSYCRLFEALKH